MGFNEYSQGDWQVLIDGRDDSWWDYKNEAINRILLVIDDEDDNTLKGYVFDGDVVTVDELKQTLDNMPEDDFYTALDDIKKSADFGGDIKLLNISDESEMDFTKEDDLDDYMEYSD
jgi:3-isopropylmalate dehydratase small subunit